MKNIKILYKINIFKLNLKRFYQIDRSSFYENKILKHNIKIIERCSILPFFCGTESYFQSLSLS